MTRLTGVLGYPVSQNLSPIMHNAAFAALGLDWIYLRFEVRPEQLEAALRGLVALGAAGANLSLPHKVAAVLLLDDISPQARLIGSVNTVAVREGRLWGDNTDGEGFLRALTEVTRCEPQGWRVAMVGAGGVARAIAVVLAQRGVRSLAIYDQEERRSAELARLVNSLGLPAQAEEVAGGREELAQKVREADLVINATPVGMYPRVGEEPVIDPAWLSPGQILYDVIHNPPETRLVKLARERGATALGGLRMLVHQGALAFELWTGQEAPREVMLQALEAELAKSAGPSQPPQKGPGR